MKSKYQSFLQPSLLGAPLKKADGFPEGAGEAVAKTVFCKMIVPLYGAVIHARSQRGVFIHRGDHKQDLETVTGLLGFSLSLLREIATQKQLPLSEQGLRYRLALSPLVAEAVACHHKKTQTVPKQESITAFYEGLFVLVQKTIQTVFRTNELQKEKKTTAYIDEKAYMRGLILLQQAVSHFAFGYDEKQLMQGIIEEMEIKAKFIQSKLGIKKKDILDAEIFEALCSLYVESHFEEIVYISSLSKPAQDIYLESFGGLFSLEPVWQKLNKRIDLSLALARRLQSS